MVLRWGATALPFAEKGFQRVRGYEHLGRVIETLRNHSLELAPSQKAA
jgi:hypothetical protein